MTEKVYRAGIIGTGRIASTIDDEVDFTHSQIVTLPYAHAGAYRAARGVELVAGAEVVAEKLQDFGRRWNVTRLYQDYEEMLAKEHLDIVSICTRPQHHAEITEKVAAAGVKGILCEKPMATMVAECDRMLAACEKHDVKLIICHNRAWHPGYLKVKEWLDQGAIGELRTMVGTFRGGLLNSATHFFHLMRRYAGDADWVSGTLPNDSGRDEPGSGIIHFKNGVIGLVDTARTTHLTITLYGTKGIIIASDYNDGFRLFQLEDLPRARRAGYTQMKEVPFPLPEGKVSTTVRAIEDLVRWLRDGNPPSASDGVDGRTTTEWGLAFHESHRRNGARVDLPLANRALRVHFD